MLRLVMTRDSFDEGIPNPVTVPSIRLVLAAAMLIITRIDPAEPARFVELTYLTLLVYLGFAGFLLLSVVVRLEAVTRLERRAHWIDFLFFLSLIALSGGSNSVFFNGLFFVVLATSFREGFARGLVVSLAGTGLYGVISVLSSEDLGTIQVNQFLLRTSWLLILGFLIAYWGETDLRGRAQIRLLRNIGATSNPRFGVDHTIFALLRRLGEFFSAESAFLVLASDDGSFSMFRTGSGEASRTERVAVSAEMGARLMSLPEGTGLLVEGRRFWILPFPRCSLTLDLRRQTSRNLTDPQFRQLGDWIGHEGFISVPFSIRVASAQLFVCGPTGRFISSDVVFLDQVVQQIAPTLDNILLIDRLTASAAEEERKRIARDLHDGAIQPYLGLKLGLTAVLKNLEEGGESPERDIRRLLSLTDAAVGSLRDYVGGLRQAEDGSGSTIQSLRRYIDRFTLATGIRVDFSGPEQAGLEGRPAFEIFQIVTEGLSNVRRHTNAREAQVRIESERNRVTISIRNRSSEPVAPFVPLTLKERIDALGGTLEVIPHQDGHTLVRATIPT
jgi:signal transduction histidine kinase